MRAKSKNPVFHKKFKCCEAKQQPEPSKEPKHHQSFSNCLQKRQEIIQEGKIKWSTPLKCALTAPDKTPNVLLGAYGIIKNYSFQNFLGGDQLKKF